MNNRDDAANVAAIRSRAYQLWVESGYADGYQDQHWRQAEREIAERASSGGADDPAAEGAADGRAARPGAGRDERGPARGAPHSDGMSLHPSVLDPAPSRFRG